MTNTTSTFHATKSPPSSSVCYKAKSDQWYKQELEVAARNAEMNRSISAPCEENDGRRRNRVNNSKKAARIGTVTVAMSTKEIDDLQQNEKSISEFNGGPLQSSIHNIMDEWSSAVLSIFSEKQALNQDTRVFNPNTLILL